MKVKKVEVITVTCNETDEILNYVNSLESQNELIRLWIIDNNSKNEETRKILKEISKKYQWVKIIYSEENLGLAGGNNVPISFLEYEYTAIVNPDTIIPSDCFSKLIKKIELDNNIVAVAPVNLYENSIPHSSYHLHWNILHVLMARIMPGIITGFIYNKLLRNFDNDIDVLFASGSFLLTRTSIYRAINGYDVNYFLTVEDVCDLCIRLREGVKTKRIIVTPDTKIIHLGARSTVGNRFIAQWGAYKGHIYHFKKHHGIISSLIVVLISFTAIFVRLIINLLLSFRSENRKKAIMYIALMKYLILKNPIYSSK